MPKQSISARVEDTCPLSGTEIVRLAKAMPLINANSKRDGVKSNVHITRYFGANPDIFKLYNTWVLWLIEIGEITEEALTL